MAWAAGQRVNQGKYKILKVLGSGGFGITYKAEFDLAGFRCQVAIKTPNAALQAASPAEYAQFVQLFRKEARTMAGLRQLSQQLSMAQVTDFFEETQGRQQDPLPCLVMDFIAGTSLWDRVDQGGPLAEGEALAYIGEVGKALAALHGQGMVHRDAHPMNIMIRESRAILIDFGLACSIVPMGSAYVNAGFPHFAAPEQWRGNREPTVDIYTLAGSLYFALTARVPDLRTPPQAHKPRLSQGVNDAIVQALSLYPDQRPATMEQWLQALGQAHRAAPPPLPPPPSPPLPPSPSPSSTKPSPPPVQPVTAKTVVAVPPPRVPPSPVAGLRTETVTVGVITGVDAAGKGGRRQAVRVQRWLEDLGGGVTLALVRIPAGSFVMGSPEKEQKRNSPQGPQHRVNFPRDGWLGQFAVTQAQYQALMGTNPATGYDSEFIDPQKPVVGVSWDDAVKFCDRLSQNTGRAYRLPTEAEWEYACRAGTTTPFSFGETLTPDLANYDGNSTYGQGPKGIYRQKTTTVGSFPANPWGLYDMHGNVWEWCLDPWSDNYSWKTEDHPALKDGTVILPYSNTSRVLRGGSWYYFPWDCRSANRGWSTRDIFINNRGFRLVLASRTPSPVQPVTSKTVPAVPPSRVPPSPVAGLRTETVTVEVLTGVDAAGNGGQRQAVRVQRWLEDLGGGVTLALVQIPAGSFVMGSPEKEQDRGSDEGPQHRVNFPRDGWLGQFQVTQAQYQAVMGTNPASRYDSKFIDPQKPVVGVSWDEAVKFCDRLSQNTGRAYRLPTEAEWEYACRAGTTTPFSFGETLTPDLANYRGDYTYGQGPKGIYRQRTTTVGSFPANPWGLYDMHGNVWEWCLDPWSDNYSWKTEDHPARKDGTIILPYSNTSRVLRGGSWSAIRGLCRSAYRNRSTRDYFNFIRGFRLVLASRTP